jgi:hypothetical protein
MLRSQLSIEAHTVAALAVRTSSRERRGVSGDSGAVTRSLQIRARSETRPTQSYDQSVMIEWS